MNTFLGTKPRAKFWYRKVLDRDLGASEDSTRTGDDGDGSTMFFVIGEYYPPNYQLVVGTDPVDSFKELAGPLGQVKPPTATMEDINNSWLEVTRLTTMLTGFKMPNLSGGYDPEDDLRLLSYWHVFHNESRDCVDRRLETGRNNCLVYRSQRDSCRGQQGSSGTECNTLRRQQYPVLNNSIDRSRKSSYILHFGGAPSTGRVQWGRRGNPKFSLSPTPIVTRMLGWTSMTVALAVINIGSTCNASISSFKPSAITLARYSILLFNDAGGVSLVVLRRSATTTTSAAICGDSAGGFHQPCSCVPSVDMCILFMTALKWMRAQRKINWCKVNRRRSSRNAVQAPSRCVRIVLFGWDDNGLIEAAMEIALRRSFTNGSGWKSDLASTAGLLAVVLRPGDRTMNHESGTGTSKILGHAWVIYWVSHRESSISPGK
ncbi:hypothetical protein EDB87DRAFT_1579997 [Lactarius vividus]|nr:hypothetical protein EDB87DRAFT_1579997 [Lactarius vividus]